MQALVSRIVQDAVHVGGGIVKVDGFLNHQVDAALMGQIGAAFASRFAPAAPTRVLTAEVSGIAPALATAQALGVSLVFARKQRSAAMTDECYRASVLSRTKGGRVSLLVSRPYLGPADRVLIVDDFLATGSTLDGLVDIVAQSGARLLGIGCVIEKPLENGRERLRAKLAAALPGGGDETKVPLLSLARLRVENDALEVET